MGSQEVDWDRLDKNKFFIYGAGMFSGVTIALYPLSVIKTKQMTLPGISGGFQGVKQTASTIMRTEGVPGFYRGFGTVIFGTIPARAVYLTTLEWTKSEVAKVVSDMGLTGPAAAGLANFAGGAVGSLATQSVTVPIDVISQKQMVHGDETVVARHQHRRGVASPPSSSSSAAVAARTGGSGAAAGAGTGPAAAPAATTASAPLAASPPAASAATSRAPPLTGDAPRPAASAAPSSSTSYSSSLEGSSRTSTGASTSTSGRPAPQAHAQPSAVMRRIGSLQMVRLILKEEGVGGLYRGFGVSVATFVPSSAIWWGAYGTYQKLIWALRHQEPAGGDSDGGGGQQQQQQSSTGEVVAVQTVSSVLAGFTSGLLTTPVDLVKTRIQVSYKHDGATPTFGEVARQILREDGAAGFLRGAVPRMINGSLWGTCMVTVYEFLKRVCAKDD